MKKTMVVIGFVGLFLMAGIFITNTLEAKGESITVMSDTLPTGRSYTSAVWDGEHAYIFGGHSAMTEYDDILRYNTSSDKLTAMGSVLPTPRDGTSAIWNGTHAFIFGGGNGASSFPSNPSGTRYNEIIRYDPKTDTITTMSATLPREIYFTSSVWDGNNAYIFGGLYDDGGSYNKSDEIIRYNPTTDAISTMTAKLPVGRSSSSCIWDGDFIYIFPGSASPNQILRYDPILDNITTMSAKLPTPPLGEKLAMTSSIWDGSNVYIFGGINENTRFFNEIFRYNIAKDNVTILSTTLPSARHGTSAIWDGINAYIFGGYTGGYLNQILQFHPDKIAPSSPFNVTAIPNNWTNTNSFIVNWTEPYDESGIKTGAWYKIGSPPTNNSDGTWQGNKPINIASIEGAQIIYVWLEDNLGNRNYTRYNTTILYLDTTPPNAFIPTANPSSWTTNTQPVISFSTTDSDSGMDHYEVQVDSGGFTSQTSPYTLPAQTDGIHTITVRAYDNAGNYRDGTVQIYIDTTPPEAPAGVSATPNSWTNTNSFEIDWTDPVETDTSGIATGAWYKIGSPPTSNSDGSWLATKPFTVSSLEGEQTIYIWLEDNVGNVDYLNYATATLYLDTTPPMAPIDLTPTPDTWTNINSFSLAWNDPTDDSGVKTGAWYKIGGAPTSNSDGTWIANKPFTIHSIEGEQPIYVWLEDNLGNVDYSNYATVNLYLDTVAPPPPGSVMASPSGWTIANSFSIDWINPADDSGVKTGGWYKLDSPPSSESEGTWLATKPMSISSLQGEHTLYVWVEDNVGNKNHLNYSTVDLHLDSFAPNITHSPVTEADSGKAITITATVTDNVAVKSVMLHYRKHGDDAFEIINMSKLGDVYSAVIPSSSVTTKGIEYYISASDEINTATYPSSNAVTEPLPVDIKDDSEPWFESWWWLLLLLAIVLIVLFLLFILRRPEEEGEVGVIEPEETQVTSTEDMEGDLGESESSEGDEDIGIISTKEPHQIPSTSPQELSDNEIYDKIKQLYEEGKVSEETFEDIKKRFSK